MATAASAGLVAACRDDGLLAFPLWERQQALLATVERGPRLHVWALGRRSGKTTMAALVALWDCLLRPELSALVRPGERRYAVAVATNLRQARLFLHAARSIVERSPLLAGLVESDTEDEILFKNGTALAAFPATSRGARGWPISTLLFDEAAHMIDTEGNQAAEPLWRALVPSTAQFGDHARLIVASTPYGTEGMFAELHAKATSGELTPEQGTLWVAGLDPAFTSDPFGLALVGRDLDNPHKLVLGVTRAWVPRGRADSFEERRSVEDEVLAEVAGVCRSYGASVVTDQHVAPAVVDRLRRAGLNVRTVPMTAQSKTAAFSELRARLYTRSLELYDEPTLLAELRRLRTRYTAGAASVVNPRVGGSHGDMAQALALAVLEHATMGVGSADGAFVGWTPSEPPAYTSWEPIGYEDML